jgi:hypothetical protein
MVHPQTDAKGRENLFLSILSTYRHAFLHVFLSLGCLASLGLITLFLYSFVNQTSEEWVRDLRYSQELKSGSANAMNLKNKNSSVSTFQTVPEIEIYLKKFPNTTESETLRVKQQLRTIQVMGRTHFKIAKDFYKWIFIATCVSSVSGVVSGICLFYISKDGWKESNRYVNNILVIFSGFAIFSTALPKIYGHEKNAENNTKLYLAYLSLEDQTMTRLALDSPNVVKEDDSTEKTPLQNIIYDMQLRIDQLNSFSVDFELDSIIVPKSAVDSFQVQQDK